MLRKNPKDLFRYGLDGEGAGLSDLEFEDSPSQGIVLEVEENEESEEFAGKSREDLLRELKEKEEAFKTREAALQEQVSPVTALQSSFASLAEKLERGSQQQRQQPVYVPQQPQETLEQFQDRIRTTFLENPVNAIAEVGEKLYGPRISQQAATISMLTKQLLMAQPEKKSIFEKYGHEIEALAATAPQNPNAIYEATEIIAARHMNDIIQERAEARAKELLAEMQKQPSGPRHVEGAGVRMAPRDERGRRVIKVTPAKKAEIEQKARELNMPVEQYIDIYVETDWQKEFR